MAVAELGVNVVANAGGFARSMKEVQKSLKATSKSLSDFGKEALKITAPIVGIGAAALASSIKLGDAYDDIRLNTGATGKDLEKLNDSFRKVFVSVPSSAEDASKAISELNIRLGLTGEPLENLSKAFLNLARVSKEDLGGLIESSTRLFNSFGVTAEDAEGTLDFFWKTAQATGISVSTLTSNLTKFAPTFKNLGLSVEESAALLGQWEKAGVNSARAITGLGKAAGLFAKENIDFKTGLQSSLSIIKNAPTDLEATRNAIGLFGEKAGPELAKAIREGNFELDQFVTNIRNGGESISDALAATDGLPEAFQQLSNVVMDALKPLGDILETILVDAINAVIPLIKSFGDWFRGLSDDTKLAIVAVGAFAAALGPVLIAAATLVTTFTALLPALTTIGTAAATVGGTLLAVLLNPITLIAGAVAGLAYLFPETFDAIIGFFVDFGSAVGEIVYNLVDAVLLATIGKGVDEVSVIFAEGIAFWIELWKDFPAAIADVWEVVKQGVVSFVNWMKDIFTSFYNWYASHVNSLVSTVSSELKKLGVAVAILSDDYSESVASLNKAVDAMRLPLIEARKETEALAKTQKNTADATEDLTETIIRRKMAEDKSAKSSKDLEAQTGKTGKATGQLQQITDKATKSTLASAAASKAAKEQREKERQEAEQLRDTMAQVRDELREQEQAWNDNARAVNGALGEYSDLANGISDLITGSKEGGGLAELINVLGGGRPEGISGPLLPDGSFSPDRIFGMDSKEMGEYSQAIEAIVAGAEKWAQIGKSTEATSTGIGSAAGTAIGATFGPEGARIGESIGSMIGEMVGGLFGGESKNAGKKARKEFVAAFNEKLGPGLVIFDSDGMAREFSGLTGMIDSYFDPNGWGERFGEMSGQAFGAFQGVGLALGGIFGTGGEVAGQIGAMLFEQLGSVENLGLAISALQIPISTFEDALLQALEQGQIGLREYVIALQGVREAFGEAEGATGDLNRAFELLVGTGGDSIQTIRMLERIIKLAMKQGVTSVDQLIEAIRQGGNFTEEQLSALASAFAAHGISAMDQLESASIETLASLLAFLQTIAMEGGANFFELADSANQAFDEIAEGAENLGRQVNDVTNGSVSVAANAGVSASAKGNIFSAGQILPFAKGGVVSKMSLFDIGSIAEQGPEAILPLERLPDGRLGVLASGSASKDVMPSINIDARGAEVGFEVRIRREIERFMDRQNRAPGRIF